MIIFNLISIVIEQRYLFSNLKFVLVTFNTVFSIGWHKNNFNDLFLCWFRELPIFADFDTKKYFEVTLAKFIMKLSFDLFFYVYLERSPVNYKDQLKEEEKKSSDRHIPRIALKPYYYSSFCHLLLNVNDQALLNATGHDRQSFNRLLQMVTYYSDNFISKYTVNRKRVVVKIPLEVF